MELFVEQLEIVKIFEPLESPMFKIPIVRFVVTKSVRLAVILLLMFAVPPAPSAMMLLTRL